MQEACLLYSTLPFAVLAQAVHGIAYLSELQQLMDALSTLSNEIFHHCSDSDTDVVMAAWHLLLQ